MNNSPWWQVALLFGGVGLLAGLFIGMAIGWRMDTGLSAQAEVNSSEETEGGENANATAVQDDLSVADQSSGKAVLVKEVRLSELGWVAVHEVQGGETMGNVLGAARLEAGDHYNIVVNLLRGTEPNKQYAVILYTDNGNKEFDLRGDLPIMTKEDKPVVVRFTTHTPTSSTGL